MRRIDILKQHSKEWVIETRGRDFHDLTPRLSALVHESGIREGLLTVLVRHTSASLMIQENADPEVRRDFERFFARLVPDGDRLFRHTAEGDDDMPAHIRSALTAVSLGIPIAEGELALGVWQGVYLWEHRSWPHSRRVRAHLIGE